MVRILLLFIFTLYMGCASKAAINKKKSECNGNLIVLYSGCHCFEQVGEDSTVVKPMDLNKRNCIK